MSLVIVRAEYGGSDVRGVVSKYMSDGIIKPFTVNDDVFLDVFGGDLPPTAKQLELVIDDGVKITRYIFKQGETCFCPVSLSYRDSSTLLKGKSYQKLNTLLLTSCDRIEQLMFALAVNKEIIQEDFNLVIADCSMVGVSSEVAMETHNREYDVVNGFSYNSHLELVREYVRSIPKIKEYKIINVDPRMEKHVGEHYLVVLGLAAAALMGSKYLVKLSGVCHLKYDIFDDIKDRIKDNVAMTWHRLGAPHEKSTRVFVCRPDELCSLLVAHGSDFFSDYYIEKDWLKALNDFAGDRVFYTNMDERAVLVDGGLLLDRVTRRRCFTYNLEKHGLLNSKDYWIRKFLDGGIWQE